MKTLIWKLAVASLLFCGCGVKGRPQPPLIPIGISRGEPSFSKATQPVNPTAKKKKIDGDFEDQSDFEPEQEEKK